MMNRINKARKEVHLWKMSKGLRKIVRRGRQRGQ